MIAKREEKGFTLLELVIAISIFSIISLLAYSGLTQVTSTTYILEQRSEQLEALQRALFLFNKDLQQLTNRGIRDEFGEKKKPVIIEDGGYLEFTRSGWRNPLGKPRSFLQRVAYRLEDGTLYRDYWQVLDRAQDSKPLTTPLISDVEEIRVEVLNKDNEWEVTWPPYQAFPDPKNPEPVLPVALRITLELKGLGKIWRTVLLVNEP